MTDEPRYDGWDTDRSEKTYPKTADTTFLPPKEEEMLPDDAKRMPVPEPGGDPGERYDSAGEHGPMAPEAARGLESGAQEEE